jgi:hypothetical protein
MRKQQGSKWRLRAVAATLLALTLAGCGGGGSSSEVETKSTATGTITATAGNSGATALSLQAPAGVTLSIPADTRLTDASGNPVSGAIATTVSYSTSPAALPATAATLPAGTTLVSYADVELAGATAVKSFSRPATLTFKVPAGAAATGDPLVLYSFDGGTGQWSFAGTEIVDADGNVSTGITHLSIWGLFKTATPPPVKPAAVAAAAGDGQATLTWGEVAGASSYNLYLATSAGVATGGPPAVSGAVSGQPVTGLTNGATYYFAVTAVNSAGQSVGSSEVSATPMPALPIRIQGVSTAGGDGKITLSWNGVSGATSYNIYYSTSAGVTKTNSTKVAGVTSPAEVSGLLNGTTYYLVMTAQNLAGEGPLSVEKSVTPAAAPQPPGETTGVALTAGAGQVTVSWRDIVPGATSYNVYYLQSASTPTTATVLGSGIKISSTASPAVITGLTPGLNYWFAVTALNMAGEGAAQTNPKKGVPLAP